MSKIKIMKINLINQKYFKYEHSENRNKDFKIWKSMYINLKTLKITKFYDQKKKCRN